METPDLAQIAALEMRANGFEPVFAPEVLHKAERWAQDGPQRSGDIRDLRDRQWFSIDNVDTLDLDQLTWAEAFPDGSVRLPMSRHAPHGIRYSLTLHDKYGARVLGYDNAHAVKPPKKFASSEALCFEQNCTRTMNLVQFCSGVLPRAAWPPISLVRSTARSEDRFRSRTVAHFGEPGFPLERFVMP